MTEFCSRWRKIKHYLGKKIHDVIGWCVFIECHIVDKILYKIYIYISDQLINYIHNYSDGILIDSKIIENLQELMTKTGSIWLWTVVVEGLVIVRNKVMHEVAKGCWAGQKVRRNMTCEIWCERVLYPNYDYIRNALIRSIYMWLFEKKRPFKIAYFYNI